MQEVSIPQSAFRIPKLGTRPQGGSPKDKSAIELLHHSIVPLFPPLSLTFVLKFFTKCRGLQRIIHFVTWERGLEVHCYADL
jgi:hypothetical protein